MDDFQNKTSQLQLPSGVLMTFDDGDKDCEPYQCGVSAQNPGGVSATVLFLVSPTYTPSIRRPVTLMPRARSAFSPPGSVQCRAPGAQVKETADQKP